MLKNSPALPCAGSRVSRSARRASIVSVGVSAGMFVPNAAMRGRGRRGGGADPWFLVMAYQLWQQIERLGPNKPRVTLACMALAAALHFNLLGDVGDAFLGASSADACVSAHRVLSRREWWRLLASPLRFADDLNLVVNLTSFLHKGHVLERARGPEGFARLLPILLLATNLAYVAVAHLAHRLRLFDARRVCLVGTTALNFALGAVADADRTATGTTTRVWGIAVPTRWASWAELGVVHLLNPHLAGLVYHACGVVAGATLVAVERRAETRRERKNRNTARGGIPRGSDGGGGDGGSHGGSRGASRGEASGGAFDAGRGFANGGAFGFAPRRSLRDGFFRRRGASAAVRAVADVPSGTRVVLSGLRATDMNGKWATSEGPDANAEGRVLVRLDDGAEFSVLPEKCIRVRTDE